MLWGFFKKLVIADNLGNYVNLIWNDIYNYKGFSLLIVLFFFSFQLYCDFSGYSDIARGTAKLFSIDLTSNFKSPYFSTNFKIFWQRWHISLSSWLCDYVYIPLGGNRCGHFRSKIHLMITFLVSGLWHWSLMTFVICCGLI